MDMQTRLDNIEEEVTCPVCAEIFSDPRILPCLHSFCLECLKLWYRKNQSTNNPRYDSITCPTCRGVSSLPESGDLNDLPLSFYLNGLVDVLAVKDSSNTHVTCGNCGEKSSEASYCFQCCIFDCGECISAHKRMRDTKNHRTLALKDFQEKDYDDLLKRPAFCPKQRHQKEELKYYCKNCKTAVCQVCSSLEHSGHAMEHVEDEANRQKEQIPSLVGKHKQNLQHEKTKLSKLCRDSAKVVQHREDLKGNIQRYAKELIAIINTKRDHLIAEAENQAKETLDGLKEKKIKIEGRMKMIEETLEKADLLISRGTNAEIIQLKQSLEFITKEVDNDKPTYPDPVESLPILVLVRNENLLESVHDKEFGCLELLVHQAKASQSSADGKGLSDVLAGCEAQFTLTTRNEEGLQCYNTRDQVEVEFRDEEGQECDAKVQVKNNEDGCYNITYCLKHHGQYSVQIKVNGELVHGSPCDLLVKAREKAHSIADLPSMSSTGHLQRTGSLYSLPERLPGHGVHPQALFVNSFQAKPVLSFGKKGSRNGQFRYPWGVAISHMEEIAVTDSENHRVQIFDMCGNHLRSFGSQGNGRGEFCTPLGICFDKDDNVFIADSGNHRVQIFTAEGRYMGMFGWTGNRDSHLSNPSGLSLDANGNIIVVDSGNKLIKIFSTNGRLLKKIGGPGLFTNPIHCVQCDDYFIVSSSDEHCIKVFGGGGDFKYQFGNQGGGDGQLKFPYGLTLTKAKQLMVCDWGNNRIQVFELGGQFVCKFGSKGRRLGEFDHPMSSAILSNGKLVVCDSRNHQIQMFD